MDLSAAAEDRSSGEIERQADLKSDLSVGVQMSGGVHGPQDDGHQFQKAISAWRSMTPSGSNHDNINIAEGINLSNLVPELDITASNIMSNQRDSVVQRKELAQKTKDFRKLEDAAKLVEFKALLKGWLFPILLFTVFLTLDRSLPNLY